MASINYNSHLDLNGDTGSKVEQAVKRVCSTPPKKGRIIPGRYYR